MADTFKRAAAWLGLVSDERYDFDAVDEETEELQTQEAPEASVSPLPAPTLVPQQADLSRIMTVHPLSYNDAAQIGESFRDGVPVIMNVSDLDEADAKRLVDFAAGLTFGLRGSIEKITRAVFLLSPENVRVAAEDKRRLVGGFFNQS